MDKTHLAEIGQRLRQRRNELNLTREEFSELADITVGYYAQLEVGTSQMSIDTQTVFAQSLAFCLSMKKRLVRIVSISCKSLFFCEFFCGFQSLVI